MLAFIPSSLADLSDLILSPYFWLPVAFQI
jgi:hypothetical protein